MDDLEFRKFLTEYGISKKEYEQMDKERQHELQNKHKSETKIDNLDKIGNGLKGCGCLIMLIPILLILLYFLFCFISELF